ncbi:hypothetical protein BFP72_01095 [Reichenbachiella sp. 5M10]|uniref:RNA polymerase sigma factor n=1 Tax=Reichenbachiella sp. 5M10 TaxID=1889772 RepID=UPI000C15ECDD|nr:RNA polymerase sigma factor [Reichenbachiella sp. 5M10]PIB34119.1 hypothetical protein BFP72_01095 [Reichenbachiella sp. 5M10]
MKESQLVSLLQQHDEEAFKVLFDTHAKRVYNTSLNFLQIQEDAEEVTQDVFLEVHEKIERFKQKSTLSTWIYRITCNKCLEFLRKAKRKKRFAFFVSVDGAETAHLSVDHPGLAAENEQKAALIQQQLETLADSQRMAFTLYHMDGQSYQEIAQIMETSLSSVESLMFRAKNNLKKKLAHIDWTES